MLRIQTDDRLAGLQQVFQQELQQEALALAGVAEDEDAAVGLVLSTAVEVHDDVASVAIPADVEAVGIGLAGVVEREQIGD